MAKRETVLNSVRWRFDDAIGKRSWNMMVRWLFTACLPLVHGSRPLPRGRNPREIDGFRRGLVAREVSPGPNRPAELRGPRLDRGRDVDRLVPLGRHHQTHEFQTDRR